MDEQLEEYEQLWSEGYMKFVPDLLEYAGNLENTVQELEKENQELIKAGRFFESGYRQYEEENLYYKNTFKAINNAFNNDQVDNELFIAEVEDVLVSLKQKGLLTDGF